MDIGSVVSITRTNKLLTSTTGELMNKQQKIGIIVIIVTLLILGLLLVLKIKTDQGMQKACQESCGKEEGGTGSCTLASCPYHPDTGSSWIIWGAALLLAFLAGVGVYLALPQKGEISVNGEINKGEINEKEPDISLLNETEKNIFTHIKNNAEGVYQRQLAQEFQLSKVQMTRLLHKLEGLDLIERKRKGFTNLVKIKE